jgi:hypothetical protein
MFFRVPAGASSSGVARGMGVSIAKAGEGNRLARGFH